MAHQMQGLQASLRLRILVLDKLDLGHCGLQVFHVLSSVWAILFCWFQYVFEPDLQYPFYLEFHQWPFPWLSESLADKYLTVNRLSHVAISPLYRIVGVKRQGRILIHLKAFFVQPVNKLQNLHLSWNIFL